MGMTLWIHTLNGREYSQDSDDHTLMCRLSDELDVICVEAGVTKLSEFFGFTDLKFNHDDEYSGLEENDESEPDDRDPDDNLDPETGLCYGIDDMTWFSAADGAKTMTALITAIKAGRPAAVGDRERVELCDELENCLRQTNNVAAQGGMFHLALVE